jgi:hypothetical protein
MKDYVMAFCQQFDGHFFSDAICGTGYEYDTLMIAFRGPWVYYICHLLPCHSSEL